MNSNKTLVDSIRWLPVELPQTLLTSPGGVITEFSLLTASGMSQLCVLFVHTTSLYIVLFYSFNNVTLLSDLLVTLILIMKWSTKYPPESMKIFPLFISKKISLHSVLPMLLKSSGD